MKVKSRASDGIALEQRGQPSEVRPSEREGEHDESGIEPESDEGALKVRAVEIPRALRRTGDSGKKSIKFIFVTR